MTWGDLMDADTDEVEYLLKKAGEINDKRRSEISRSKSRSSRGRRF